MYNEKKVWKISSATHAAKKQLFWDKLADLCEMIENIEKKFKSLGFVVDQDSTSGLWINFVKEMHNLANINDKKEEYDAIFHLFSQKLKIEDAIEDIGLTFDFSFGTFGNFSNDFLNILEERLMTLLELHVEEEKVMGPISIYDSGTIEVLYQNDKNYDWSITFDDWYSMVDDIRNGKLDKDLVFDAFTTRDNEKRLLINKSGKRKNSRHVAYMVGVIDLKE